MERTVLCNLCLILLLGVNAIVTDGAVHLDTSAVQGDCCCSAFGTETPGPDATPLLSQMPGLLVACDDSGAAICQNLCLALATATKAVASAGFDFLCEKLHHADELKLSAFYKVCDKPWVFAGMTADAPLCCHNSKQIPCA